MRLFALMSSVPDRFLGSGRSGADSPAADRIVYPGSLRLPGSADEASGLKRGLGAGGEGKRHERRQPEMNWIMTLIVLLGGAATAVQAGVNGALGRKVGTIEGAFTSFLIGTVALFLLMIFLGKGNVLQIVSLPKWQLTGGLLGALYVIGMVFAVPKIGVASSMVAVIAGQLLTSTILDHFGVMSGKPIPIDWQRVVGIVLLAAALFLFYKR